jgi:hypothetical protein
MVTLRIAPRRLGAATVARPSDSADALTLSSLNYRIAKGAGRMSEK